MAFIRKIKKGKSTYLVKVENYRSEGKVKQRVLEYLGREIKGKAVKKIYAEDVEVKVVREYLDYKAVYDVAMELGLRDILGEHANYILLIVISQLITRRSLYKLPEHHQHTCLLELLELKSIDSKVLYNTLDMIQGLDFQAVEEHLFNKFLKIKKDKSAMVIDVTDTYFSGSQADWKSRRGKDGKYDKLIQLALAVTKDYGFPIFHKTYEGNISNVKIFQDMVADARLKFFDLIIMDRGMISMETLQELYTLKQSVITGLRLTEGFKKEFIDKIDREEIYQPACKVQLKNTEVFIKSFPYGNGMIIAIYNPELETHKRRHAMRKEKDYSPEKAKYAGFSLLFNSTTLGDKEVVKMYFEKDIVEKAYKEIKSSVHLHPVRKYLIEHVQAHVKICYLSYAILAWMQNKLKTINMSATEALIKLQPVHKVTLHLKDKNINWSKIVTLTREQGSIVKALNCSV